ncbi:hypothetical protein [Sulfurovum sp.]|uniref:hypothetical protein n=2 Tax=Sulfurovum sp. TaxID=1969726 RepID=UPI0025D62620|nr:hypothetical protein [Sulfurovum sp.]
MKMKVALLVALSLLFLGCQEKEYKNEELKNKLTYIGEQKGPFDNTLIIKYYDEKLNTMCYTFVPKSVSTTYSNDMVFINGFGGNISCVKL